jgi:hypothetical protein
MRMRRHGAGSTGGLRALLVGMAIAAGTLGLHPSPSGALPVDLEDGVATLSIDAATGALSAWTVDGAAHVREQSLHWRVGTAGGEASPAALTFVSQLATDGDSDGDLDTLVLTFSDAAGRFDLEARWSLTGSAFGSPSSGAGATLAFDVSVVNRTAGVLDFSLFQYTDADLFGSFADDSAAFGASNGGSVSDGSGLATWSADWDVAPDSVEASIYGALLASLGDGAPTALSGALAAGTGDVTLGVGWRVLLDPGATFTRGQTQEIVAAPIPEPGVAVLLGAGLAAIAARRRGRRNTMGEVRS